MSAARSEFFACLLQAGNKGCYVDSVGSPFLIDSLSLSLSLSLYLSLFFFFSPPPPPPPLAPSRSPRDPKHLPSFTDLDCFARIAIAPFAPQKVMGSPDIPKGYSMSGRLHLLGQSVRVGATFDVAQFQAKGKMEKPVVLGNVALVVASDSEPQKGPAFEIKVDDKTGAANSPPPAAITGFLQLPGLFVQAPVTLAIVNGGVAGSVSSTTIFGMRAKLSFSVRVTPPAGGSSNTLGKRPYAQLAYKAKLRPTAVAYVNKRVQGAVASQVAVAAQHISEITATIAALQKNSSEICHALQAAGKLNAEVKAACDLASAATKAKTVRYIRTAQKRLRRTRANLVGLLKAAVPGMGSKSAIASLFVVSEIELSGKSGDGVAGDGATVHLAAKFAHQERKVHVVEVKGVNGTTFKKKVWKWEKGVRAGTGADLDGADQGKIAAQLIGEVMKLHPAIKGLGAAAAEEYKKLDGFVEAAIEGAATYISKRTRCTTEYIADGAECGFAMMRNAKKCGMRMTRSAKLCGRQFAVSARLCGSDRITSVRCGLKRVTSGSKCGFDTEIKTGRKTARSCNVPKTCKMPVSPLLFCTVLYLCVFCCALSPSLTLSHLPLGHHHRNGASLHESARSQRAARWQRCAG